MISEIQIENFKSISKLSLKPGNVTVLIGENGSGKSNILEAITFAAAASADKLDDEFLFNRGIRVTEKDWMTSAFQESAASDEKAIFQGSPIRLKVESENQEDSLEMKIRRFRGGNSISDNWFIEYKFGQERLRDIFASAEYLNALGVAQQDLSEVGATSEDVKNFLALARIARLKAPDISAQLTLQDFLIYAPENSVLRNPITEGAIKPLGPKGEGLLKLLQLMSIINKSEFEAELKSRLNLLGWFEDLQLPTEVDEMQGRLRIRDKWLSEKTPFFDQRSANEGFLYLLFYFTLMLSSRTPRFFAIDNIDNALNPKLCAELMRQIAVLAAEKGKQVICTTHNPAILDGLNLHDDRQRLYVVRRDSEGHTVANRVQAPRPRPDGASVPLSTAFMSGLLGGLPDHF